MGGIKFAMHVIGIPLISVPTADEQTAEKEGNKVLRHSFDLTHFNTVYQLFIYAGHIFIFLISKEYFLDHLGHIIEAAWCYTRG